MITGPTYNGNVVFDLLFPLVLPEGSGDHRYYSTYNGNVVFDLLFPLVLPEGSGDHRNYR